LTGLPTSDASSSTSEMTAQPVSVVVTPFSLTGHPERRRRVMMH
jgi:hypothetical protein